MSLSPNGNFTMIICVMAEISGYSLLFNVFLLHEDVDITIHHNGLFGSYYTYIYIHTFIYINLIFDTLYFLT